MTLLQRLANLTDIQLATYLSGGDIEELEVNKLRWISKYDVLKQIEFRTQKFKSERVKALLDIFKNEAIILKCSEIKINVYSKRLNNPDTSLTLTEIEIEELLALKQGMLLYAYAVEVLESKTYTKDASIIFKEVYSKILPYLEICTKKKILDKDFQFNPNINYTKGEKAMLASILLEKAGIPTGEKANNKKKSFGYFDSLWGEKGLSSAYYDVINKQGTVKNQLELENLFK